MRRTWSMSLWEVRSFYDDDDDDDDGYQPHAKNRTEKQEILHGARLPFKKTSPLSPAGLRSAAKWNAQRTLPWWIIRSSAWGRESRRRDRKERRARSE